MSALQIVNTYARFSRSWFLIGADPPAAAPADLATKCGTVLAYINYSFVASIERRILTVRTGSIEPNLGDAKLHNIAAAVIGGLNLRGGQSSVVATHLGTNFISILSNDMRMLQIIGYIQQIVLSLVTVAVVSFDRKR